MQMEFIPLTTDNQSVYMDVGTQSYEEHYLHLWTNRDPTPYLNTSFTPEVVQQELQSEHCFNYLVKCNDDFAGILKLVTDKGWGAIKDADSLYLHRLYLLRKSTGQGVGQRVLEFVEAFGKKRNKSMIWLEAMKKGQAKNFYKNQGFKIIGDSTVNLNGVLHEEKEMWVMYKHIGPTTLLDQ